MNEGKTQEAAAAAAGMSVRSAREWKAGSLPSETTEPRSWRTRPDPFEGVWRLRIEPLLERDRKGKLEAKTLLEVLVAEDPKRFSMGQLRTMQRRLRDWRALERTDQGGVLPAGPFPGRTGRTGLHMLQRTRCHGGR